MKLNNNLLSQPSVHSLAARVEVPVPLCRDGSTDVPMATVPRLKQISDILNLIRCFDVLTCIQHVAMGLPRQFQGATDFQ
jgi:hypothetical protein